MNWADFGNSFARTASNWLFWVYILQIFGAVLVSAWHLRSSKFRILRLLLGVLTFAALSFFSWAVLGWIGGVYSRYGRWLFVFASACIALSLYSDNSFSDVLFSVTIAFSLQNIVSTFEYKLLYFQFGLFDPLRAFAIEPIMYGLFYALSFLVLRKRIQKDKPIMMSYSQLLPLSALDLLAVSTLQAYLPSDSQTEAFFSGVILISIDAIIVFLLLSIKANIEMKHEYLMIQATLSKEDEYYDQMRNYSKVIDAKCHDLKKFISAKEIVKEKEGITKEMIKEIEETVASYSNMPLTGNKALDIVLSEKVVICERNHITFTYDVDGKQFSFLSNSDIVSIFNNLLYNAIEYASQLQDENKRIISLTAAKKNEFLAVHVENYFDGPIKLVEGLPITTKKDSEIHGYGLKSVRYVAQKYGGTMEIGTSNHVFSADVLIPLA